MSAVVVLFIGLGAMALAYFVYSKFIAEKIYRLDPDFKTPAHEFEDGIDFVPTNCYVLWGHHFTSVAGAAPIVRRFACPSPRSVRRTTSPSTR